MLLWHVAESSARHESLQLSAERAKVREIRLVEPSFENLRNPGLTRVVALLITPC